MNLKTAASLASVVILAAAVMLMYRCTREEPSASPVAEPAPVARTTTERSITLPKQPYHGSVDQAETDKPGERNEARPEPGGGEGQLEHMFRSVLNANSADLNLSREEAEQVVFDYLEFQEVHAELAARFLQETGFDPSSVTLRLPAYPVEGKILRDMFYRRLETDLSTGKAAEVKEHLGAFFDNTFRGFGVTEQTFTITRSPEVPDAFEVQWEAKAPEGQTTSAMNPEVSFAGNAGTLLLYREQVQSGEFRFLGKVVDHRFPDTSGKSAQP